MVPKTALSIFHFLYIPYPINFCASGLLKNILLSLCAEVKGSESNPIIKANIVIQLLQKVNKLNIDETMLVYGQNSNNIIKY